MTTNTVESRQSCALRCTFFTLQYRRLQLPRVTKTCSAGQSKFKVLTIKLQSLSALGNALAPLTEMIVADLSSVWQLKTWRLQ